MIKNLLGLRTHTKSTARSSANDDYDVTAVPTTSGEAFDLPKLLSLSSESITEAQIPTIIDAAGSVLFRPFPPRVTISATPGDDEEPPFVDPLWTQKLLPVYELLLRVVTNPNFAKRHVSNSFLLNLLALADSPDPRERDRVKTLIHRLYRKFPSHRPFLRTSIANILSYFIYETDKHNGVSEILEVLGSIINGYALPLKEEHKLFLVKILLPLHKSAGLATYHQQLSYCVTQFVEKDAKLADTVVRGLLKFWPVTSASKEVLFLGEMEEVLEETQAAEFKRCMVPLCKRIGDCVGSYHFQVAERALYLWNNDHVRNLIIQNQKVILPIIIPALEKNKKHWNETVRTLTQNIRKIFLDADQELVEQCLKKFNEDEAKEKDLQLKREMLWKRIEDIADSKGIGSNENILVSRVVSSLGLASNASTTTVVNT